MEKDYYKLLGVSREATDDEIKKAFHKLSMKHHPDKGGDKETYQNITQAYNILSDPVKRLQYNQGQSNPSGNEEDLNTNTSRPGVNPQSTSFRFNGFGTDFFPQHFGGFGNIFNNDPFERHHQRQPKMDSYTLHLSLEELYYGGEHEIAYSDPVTIGNETYNLTKSITITIPEKCHIGKKYKISIPSEKNNQIKQTMLIIIQAKKHETYKLQKNPYTKQDSDFSTTIKLTLRESLSGFRVKLPTIYGKTLTIEERKVIDPRHPYRLVGKGYYDSQGRRGDLYIHFDIQYPKEPLSDDQRQLLKDIL